MKYKAYYRPDTLSDAERLLAELNGPVLLLAGGTDVMVYAREDDRYAEHSVVDIYHLPELRGITEEGDTIRIGAGTTHTEIETSALIQSHANVLAMACRTVGSRQIRDHATIAGNICNASPAADSLGALAVLGAVLEVRRNGETVLIPLSEVIEKPYRTALSERDLVLAVRIRKLPADEVTHFWKLGRRKALAISRMTIATILHRDENGVVDDFNITVGATFPRPMTFQDVNALLLGKKPDAASVKAVAKALSDKIPEIAGIRKSTTFKQPVCRNMTERILSELLLEDEQ